MRTFSTILYVVSIFVFGFASGIFYCTYDDLKHSRKDEK